MILNRVSASILYTLCVVTIGCGSADSGKTVLKSTNVEGRPTPSPTPVANLDFPTAFDSNGVYTETRFISPTGSDITGNGTNGSPYASLGRALQNRLPGLRIIMLPGRYGVQGSFSNVQGTATNPIAIIGQGAAVIDAAAGPVGLGFSDARYLVVENIIIENSPVHGLNIDDGGTYESPSTDIVFRNMIFRQIGTGGNNDCLKMSGVDRFFISGSEFSGCSMGEAIDMVGCHEGTITGNFFHDMPGTAVQAKGGSRNVFIHGNRFRNVVTHSINLGGATGDPFVRPITAPYEGERIVAMSNVFEASGTAVTAFMGCNECLVANNTIINPVRWVARVLQGSRDTSITISRAGTFINNIIYYRRADLSVFVNVGPNTEPSTFIFNNNLYFATDGVAFNGVHGSGIPNETNSLYQQNPEFLSFSNGNYRISFISPARGRGRSPPFGRIFHYDRLDGATPPDVGAFR